MVNGKNDNIGRHSILRCHIEYSDTWNYLQIYISLLFSYNKSIVRSNAMHLILHPIIARTGGIVLD